jgi:hypothetical protein
MLSEGSVRSRSITLSVPSGISRGESIWTERSLSAKGSGSMVVVTWTLSTTMNFTAGRTGPLCGVGDVCCGGVLVCGWALGVCWERTALEQSRSRARLGRGLFIRFVSFAGMNQ